MTRAISKGFLIAAVAGAALSLAVSGTAAQGMKKDAKMAKPAGPGLCTAHMNTMHWGWLNYRTTSGNLLPTAMWCPEASCPAKC